jgi:hypothetical protein
MNNASFYTKVQVLKPNANCKNRFMNMDELFLSIRHRFVNLDETHPIMITSTPSIESATSDYVMESSFVDFIPKLIHINSRPKGLKSISTDFGVESFSGYSRLEFFLANSELEFVIGPKFATTLPKKYCLVGFQLFN